MCVKASVSVESVVISVPAPDGFERHNILLSVDDARALRDELNKLFGGSTVVSPTPAWSPWWNPTVPVTPTVPDSQKMLPWKQHEVWCSGGTQPTL